MVTWIEDANGNRCSVEWFGSREAAQKTLDSLENCENCTNCWDCSGCSPNLPVSPVRFFEGNDTARADMKRMADLEAAQKAGA